MPDPVNPTPPPAPSKARVFLRRLISSAILWTVVIVALFNGDRVISGVVFVLVMTTLAVFGLMEFYGLVAKSGLP